MQRNFLPVVRPLTFARTLRIGKTTPTHAAEPRHCRCQPRASGRIGAGLGLGLGSGWSGQTCKIEHDHKRPARKYMLPARPACWGSQHPGGVILNIRSMTPEEGVWCTTYPGSKSGSCYGYEISYHQGWYTRICGIKCTA